VHANPRSASGGLRRKLLSPGGIGAPDGIGKRHGRRGGCNLSISSPRLDEIHGPFCNVLRNTLNLLPDGSATDCFLCTDATDPTAEPWLMHKAEDTRSGYGLDGERLSAHRRAALSWPSRCEDCVNVCHCTLDCPERCVVRDSAPEVPSFRCLVQRLLAEAWILEIGTRSDASQSS
jgi:hypothetical protein